MHDILLKKLCLMKSPSSCKNKEEIRQAIDELDRKIISLIGKRYQYVKEIVKYKEKTPDAIVAKERYNLVIASRRALAEENGLNPDIIEEMYKRLLQYFIQEELDLIK